MVCMRHGLATFRPWRNPVHEKVTRVAAPPSEYYVAAQLNDVRSTRSVRVPLSLPSPWNAGHAGPF
jgi:hypothetical protein